jgi:hypothetical protein
MERKSSATRRNIFLKIAVITFGVVSVLFILYEFKLNLDNKVFKDLKAYSNNFHICTLQSTNKEQFESCYKEQNEKYNYQTDQFGFFIITGFLLSLYIFSLILIYKNIFHVKKTHKR